MLQPNPNICVHMFFLHMKKVKHQRKSMMLATLSMPAPLRDGVRRPCTKGFLFVTRAAAGGWTEGRTDGRTDLLAWSEQHFQAWTRSGKLSRGDREATCNGLFQTIPSQPLMRSVIPKNYPEIVTEYLFSQESVFYLGLLEKYEQPSLLDSMMGPAGIYQGCLSTSF